MNDNGATHTNWPFVPLGECSTVHPGQHILENAYNRRREGIPYLTGPADFGEISPLICRWTGSPKAWALPGDVLVTVKGAGVGKTNLAPEFKVAIGRQLMAVRPGRVLNQRYLFYFFRHVFERFQQAALGATVPGLGRDDIESLEIPLPPIAEQERIAAWLTAQLAAVESARAAAQVRLAAAEALPAAYLREVFEGLEGTVPTRFLADISELASGITLGKRPHAINGREVPYLRVANVQDGHLLLDDVYTIRATDEEIEELKLRRGDLVLTEGGDRDKLGRGTWWNEELPECIHQNHIFRVRLQSGVIDHEFFGFQIQSAYAKNYFLAHAKQTTGIATINRRVLGALPVLLPNPTEQRGIAADLALRLAKAERLTAVLRDELAAIDALPAALLREAFNGQT
jgi:type I restriction enzyme S subunit